MPRKALSAPYLSEKLKLVRLDLFVTLGIVAIDPYVNFLSRLELILCKFDLACALLRPK